MDVLNFCLSTLPESILVSLKTVNTIFNEIIESQINIDDFELICRENRVLSFARWIEQKKELDHLDRIHRKQTVMKGYIALCETGNLFLLKQASISNLFSNYTSIVAYEAAAKMGQLEVMKYLEGKFHYHASGCVAVFHEVCKANNQEIYKHLIDQYGEKRAVKLSGFYGAIEGGHIDFAESLKKEHNPSYFHISIQYACKVNNQRAIRYTDNLFNSHWGFLGACEGGHKELAEDMYELNHVDIDLDEAIYVVYKNNHRHMIQYLIDKGPINFDRALAGACVSGNVDLAQDALDRGASDVNWAFIEACMAGQIETMKFLRAKVRNFNGAFMATCNDSLSIKKEEVLYYLIQWGATECNCGKSPDEHY